MTIHGKWGVASTWTGLLACSVCERGGKALDNVPTVLLIRQPMGDSSKRIVICEDCATLAYEHHKLRVMLDRKEEDE